MRNWVMVVAWVLGASSASAQEQPQPGAQDYIAGEAAFKKGDMDAAIASLQKAVDAGGPVAAHFYLGMAYNRKQNPQKAAEHLEKYVTALPTVFQAQLQLGMALRSMKKNAEAGKVFEKVIELKADVPEPYYFLGQDAYSRQDYDTATARLAKFLSLKPDHVQAPVANYMLGHIAVMKTSADPNADTTQAKEYLNKFLAKAEANSPLAPDAHFMLGTMAARKVETLEPPEGKEPMPEEKARLAEIYAEAKAELEKYIAIAKPDAAQVPDAYYTLGSLAIRMEDDLAATANFTKFLELRPDSPQAAEVKQILEDLKAAAKNKKK